MMTQAQRIQNETRARILKALAHPTRVYIVDRLQHGSLTVHEIADEVDSDMSTVSRHLAALRDAGVLQSEKSGSSIEYSLTCPCIPSIFAGIEIVIRKNEEARSQIASSFGLLTMDVSRPTHRSS